MKMMDKQTKLAIGIFVVIVALILILAVYGCSTGRWDVAPEYN
jgi:hypothetical protein